MQTEMKYALNEICTIRTSNKRFAVDHLKKKTGKTAKCSRYDGIIN